MNINEPQRGVLRHSKRQEPGAAPLPDRGVNHRLWMLNMLPLSFRGHAVAVMGEFVGTFLFLFFAMSGTQVANTTNTKDEETQSSTQANTMYIAVVFGFSLVVNAWVFFRVSGGLFNPAVTLGMCVVGCLTWLRGAMLFISQMAGALSAAAVVSVLFPGNLIVQTELSHGTSTAQGLFIEMFLTAGLVLTIFLLAAEKHKATFIAPIGIGLSLFIAQLSGVYFTGASLNPARSFAPAAVNHAFHGYHWIYWLGPALGALLAAGFYKLIKALEYETANPAADIERDAGSDDSTPDVSPSPDARKTLSEST